MNGMETLREGPRTAKNGKFGCQGPVMWQNAEEVLRRNIEIGQDSTSEDGARNCREHLYFWEKEN